MPDGKGEPIVLMILQDERDDMLDFEEVVAFERRVLHRHYNVLAYVRRIRHPQDVVEPRRKQIYEGRQLERDVVPATMRVRRTWGIHRVGSADGAGEGQIESRDWV